ncbi:MAG: phosphoribosylformylglycinamidine synthase subunit PurL [Nitrospinae bacterium]|nr:phosphoribosylformylglycinamidine synthase subunit PurL [Nitrospinota bacterium]
MQKEVTVKTALDHGLNAAEFESIKKHLGRVPNLVELGIFSAMWSEHCSYKSSRVHLRRFPTEGPQVVQGPGENAGVVDIGNGLTAVFKMESHNHPSFIEPVQGAATGVGGILRDVFTMGARPIASFDCLRFGHQDHEKTRFLVGGVVKGISMYGNCIGVPTVGGSTRFHECYNGNILVNVMTVGIARRDALFFGKASGLGNKIIYIGSKTGRDGIHGAVMASDTFGEESESKRPTVQVGDPFTEKLLLEACLEIFRENIVEGIQDMGAAGLTSSSFEMASRGNSGITMHLDKVPMREEGMTPYEIMLSESQERMLLVAKPENEQKILDILRKWDLEAATIGQVEDHGHVKLLFHGELAADMPVDACVDTAPKYERPMQRPAYLEKTAAFDTASVPAPASLNEAFFKLVGSLNLNGKRWITEQYDTMIGLGSVFGPGHDAAVIRVMGTNSALAVSSGCNERYCYLDPYVGGMIALAECARNVACTGAKPLASTDCLNFGSPMNPEIMWQFSQSVDGIAEACRKLDVPVVGGNVSLYNQTGEVAIYPTPMIGVVGLLDDATLAVPSFFQSEGDAVLLLGDTLNEIGGSEYLKTIHGHDAGKPPALDLTKERNLINALMELARKRLVKSAHDCSEGGLAIALAECALDKKVGCEVDIQTALRPDVALFSESQSRAVLSVAPQNLKAALAVIAAHKVPCAEIGKTAKAFAVKVNGKAALTADIADIVKTHGESFEKTLFPQ